MLRNIMYNKNRIYIVIAVFLICPILFSTNINAQAILEGHWSFDGDLDDSSTNALHASFDNGVDFSSYTNCYYTNIAKLGDNSLWFSGRDIFDGHIAVRNPGPIKKILTNNSFSFTAWVYRDSTKNDDGVIFTFWKYPLHLGLAAGEQGFIVKTGDEAGNPLVDSISIISNNVTAHEDRWIFVVYTFEANTKIAKIYTNGLLSISNQFSQQIYIDEPQTGEFMIGAKCRSLDDENDGANHWQGFIDDPSLWRYDLTAGEVLGLYNIGSNYKYNADEYNQLRQIYANKSGTNTINGYTWIYATNLNGSAGELVNGAFIFESGTINGKGVMLQPPTITNFISYIPPQLEDIVLSWNSSSATIYTLYRAIVPDVNSNNLSVGLTNITTYTDKTHFTNMINYYWIKGYNDAGGSVYYTTSTQLTAPSAPVLNPVKSDGNDAIITFQKVDHATYYKLYWYSASNSTTNYLITISTGYSATNLIHAYANNPRPIYSTYSNYYFVKTSNKAGISKPSSTNGFKFPPPSPPTWIHAEVVCGTNPTITWENVNNEGYILFSYYSNNTNRIALGKNITNYVDTNTIGFIEYTYHVQVSNAELQNSSNSRTTNIIALGGIIPETPIMKQAVPRSTSIIDLAWADSPNETSYTLFRSTINNIYHSNTTAIEGFEAGKTNYTDLELNPGTTYYYWIRAYSSNSVKSCEIDTNFTFAKTYDNFKLNITTRARDDGNKVMLDWPDVSTNYWVYRGKIPIDETSDVGSYDVKLLTEINVPSYTDYDFNAGSTYFYNVAYQHITNNITNMVFSSPANNYISMMLYPNDIGRYYDLTVNPISLSSDKSNPAGHELIRGEVINIYNVEIAEHPFTTVSISVEDETPDYDKFKSAITILDYSNFLSTSGVNASEKGHSRAYGAKITENPYIVYDMEAIFRVTNVSIYKPRVKDHPKWVNDLRSVCISVAGPAYNFTPVGCKIFPLKPNTNALKFKFDKGVLLYGTDDFVAIDIPDGHQEFRYLRIDLATIWDEDAGANGDEYHDTGMDFAAIGWVDFELLPIKTDRFMPKALQRTFDLILPYNEDRLNRLDYDELSLGIFILDGNEWRYVGGEVETGNNIIKADVTEVGIFGIFPIDRSKIRTETIYIEKRFLTVDGDGSNEKLDIRFNFNKETELDVRIMDISGAVVRNLASRQKVDGNFVLTWDGTDIKGNKLMMGPYIYQIRIDGKVAENGVFLLVR